MTVWLALMVLTYLTVRLSHFDLGGFRTLIALAVATTKALIVCWWFMHLKEDKGLNIAAFAFSFVIVVIFMAFTFTDMTIRVRMHETGMPERFDVVKALEPARDKRKEAGAKLVHEHATPSH